MTIDLCKYELLKFKRAKHDENIIDLNWLWILYITLKHSNTILWLSWVEVILMDIGLNFVNWIIIDFVYDNHDVFQ